MTFPNETLPKGRRQKTTALYDRLVARGAVMGTSFGLEHALWFANDPSDAHEEPTFGRNRSHAYVADEVRTVRERVGAIEIANFGKHEVRGPGARAFLGRMLAGHLPSPGRVALSPMLTPRGRLYGDLTVSCLTEDHYLLLGSGPAQDMHRRWFESHAPASGVSYRNVSDALHGIALSGPLSRQLLQRSRATTSRPRASNSATCAARSSAACRSCWSGCRSRANSATRSTASRSSSVALWEHIEAAGADLGQQPYGARTLMSLRLEKNWGVWTLDYRPDYTAAESGLDALIDWRRDFIGRDAALAERERGPARKLVSLVVDTPDRDVVGDEAVLQGERCVGHVTSGGYAHHVGRSMAMAYVPPDCGLDGTALEVEINGERFQARVVATPLHDPSGGRMRG